MWYMGAHTLTQRPPLLAKRGRCSVLRLMGAQSNPRQCSMTACNLDVCGLCRLASGYSLDLGYNL